MHTLELPPSHLSLGDLLVQVFVVDETAPREAPARALVSGTLRPHGKLVVGSGRGVDLPVPESTVSAEHVALEHLGDGVRVTDLSSTNGTKLLGHALQCAHVLPGARFTLGRAELHLTEARWLLERPATRFAPLAGLLGRSEQMQRLAGRVRQLSALGVPVLIRGESGTGKDLVARALHKESRRTGELVALNAATLSDQLAGSELFGHRRGAFTGASSDRRGAFREADGGTLFIDEVARLRPEVQAKLLRVVEEGTVRPLGGDGVLPVDVRLLAATCEPLEREVEAGRFRRDLFERLAVCVIHVPPLRSRRSDLPELARHLLAELNLGQVRLAPSAMAVLSSYGFPGNVRELRSLLLLAAISAAEARVIEGCHVEAALRERGALPELSPTPQQVLEAVHVCGGNQSEAARRLGIPRTTLRDLLARAGDQPRERPTQELPALVLGPVGPR